MIARGAGCVTRTLGGTVLAALPGARVGDGVRIHPARNASIAGEVAAVKRSRVAISPFGAIAGIGLGDRVEVDPTALWLPLGFAALGRIFDAAGSPLDGRPAIDPSAWRNATRGTPLPSERAPVADIAWTGIRALDGLLTIGRGARVGLFGAPGAGKTTLLEMMAGAVRADAVVLGLTGERGREAQTWFGRSDPRTTIVCATADRSAAERVRAADIAMSQAQVLRERGLHVVLIVDSLARYAGALRERRLALGEPVGRGGYPPSVWAELARYLERAGNAGRGSITLFATVLTDGDDERDPLAEAARSLLDGHVVLSSALARAGHYPAIDVLASSSRTMPAVVAAGHARDAALARSALALLAQTQDARTLGLADRTGPLQVALGAEDALRQFLRQDKASSASETLASLRALAAGLESFA